jgi:hypothetical protein
MSLYLRPLFFGLLFVFFSNSLAQSPVISAERSVNLKTVETSPLLYEFHRLTTTDTKRHYYFPRRDSSWRNNEAEVEKSALLRFNNKRGSLAASLIGGVEYKSSETLADTIFPSIDGGLYLRGYIDSVEFMLDARIYNERHYNSTPKSFDREFLEHQKEENNSGFEYTSYARYRGHFAINMGFARLDFARDVMHWGPGYYNNLSLNQFAVPFNSMSFELQLGPLSVVSFYGDLLIHNNSMSMQNKKSRNLYGHRYELNLSNWVLGISELQVLYDNNKPWLFVPIVPLFMEKGNYSENSNNGSLSFDVAYHFLNLGRVYSEFFLDDMESPISLIRNDNIEAKWAWMAGLQLGHDFRIWNRLLELGSIVEYARVEPYVYSHFHPSTAQLAHLGYPLGNQSGPNSQTIDWTIYSRFDSNWNLSLQSKWLWKGDDYGSAVNDTTPTSNHMNLPKKFIDGAKMEYSLSPSLSYDGQYVAFLLQITLFHDEKIYTRLGFKW